MGYFYLLAIVNNAAMSMTVQVLAFLPFEPSSHLKTYICMHMYICVYIYISLVQLLSRVRLFVTP